MCCPGRDRMRADPIQALRTPCYLVVVMALFHSRQACRDHQSRDCILDIRVAYYCQVHYKDCKRRKIRRR